MILILALASSSLFAVTPDVIYGEDNRTDTINSKSALFKTLATSTAVQIAKRDLGKRSTKLEAPTLNDFISMGGNANLCEDEPFRNQVAAGNCSGFLVAPDLLVTAGHCYGADECETYDWVFDYKIAHAGDLSVTVKEENTYSCEKIVAIARPTSPGQKDFAVIKLDRSVRGVTPLKVAEKTPGVGTEIVVIGYPSGLPQKITDGAEVRKKLPNGFKANLDTFRGNSGSAVFNAKSGEVVGILVNGANDWSFNGEKMCMSAAKLPATSANEGVSGVEQFKDHLK